jgi:hypothetical protein
MGESGSPTDAWRARPHPIGELVVSETFLFGVEQQAPADAVGQAAELESIAVGSYAAPPGPDWGWRIEIAAEQCKALRLVMFNIWPDGKEELAVEAAYVRT